MAYLVEQFTSDRGVQLGVESFTRLMPWGTSWNKIRIGCRLATNGTSTIPAGGVNQPIFGICTGPEAYASSVTVDAIFWQPLNSQNAVYSGSAPNNFYDYNGSSNNQTWYQKIGTGVNYLGNYTGMRVCWSANPTALLSVWMFDIVKSSATQATMTAWMPNNTQVLINCTRSNFLAMMENESAPPNVSASAAFALTLVRQVKDWDSVFFHWGRAVPTTTFNDMTVVRFY